MEKTQVEAELAAKLCTERGGVPIVVYVRDTEQHTFKKLERCEFPPVAPQLRGEK